MLVNLFYNNLIKFKESYQNSFFLEATILKLKTNESRMNKIFMSQVFQ